MNHWIYKYIGKPWGMTYDCFAHFAEVQGRQFGVDDFDNLVKVPNVLDYGAALDYAKNDESVSNLWRQVDKPQDGDGIVFGMGRIKFHIGTYIDIDSGGVLHCSRSSGVTFTPMRRFKQNHIKIEMIIRHRSK